MQDWKMTDKIKGPENGGVENERLEIDGVWKMTDGSLRFQQNNVSTN
jgi:hypothetical protein